MAWNLARGSAVAVLAAGLLIMLATPVHAHHSGAMFDMAHPITLTGVVTKVEWTNPHTFMYVNVKNDIGRGPGVGDRDQQPQLSSPQRLDQHHHKPGRQHHHYGSARQERFEIHARHERGAIERRAAQVVTFSTGA